MDTFIEKANDIFNPESQIEFNQRKKKKKKEDEEREEKGGVTALLEKFKIFK